MKIIRIETFDTKYVGFVRITAEDGSIGWGQVSTYNSDITCQVLHRQVARWVLNRDTRDLDDLLDLVTEREHKFPGSYLRRAMAGFDTAIWDLRGRQAGKSVAELLGGTPGPIRAYASSMKRDITPADEADRMKRLRDLHGFDAFKVRAGAEVGRNRDEWPGRTEEVITTMHREMGDTATLLIDANSCYSPDRAIEIGRMLEQNGFSHFEEPCPYWELEQTKQVTDTLDIDVTGGEQDCDLTIWTRMIDMRAVDIVQPDILYLGGIARTLRVARMAQAAKLPVTPHCANLSLVTLFTMHLLRAIPNAGKYLEFSIEGADYYPWQEGLFTSDPYRIDDGQAIVTDAPGWGIEVSPDWLARAHYSVSSADQL
ncbi:MULTISPECIES: mandelate racemase/muconate lactonizing enzyme family protein [Roseobacteraceae]|uniref:D-galactarolactone cycloisomerase n=1 Tax=Pseudosulfitobacter pseudonitzschiae TaxID=1402135 RepID=A0A221JXW9_9RHOB|nr:MULTISPECIES: mandelate racemase/muconate lactonizing enzyme family protein [Roseobacteraceae]ASM71578.1 D-galactarolactone cycloisomerase [Pseudosulfitobacter pseudonitzschiae]